MAERGLVFKLTGALAGVAAACAVVAALAVSWMYASWAERPVLDEGESRTVVIPRGTAWPGVVRGLREAEVVRRGWFFEYWSRQRGLPRKVKAGTYRLAGPLSLDELAEELERGGQLADVTVTVPEGFTIFHVADRLEALGLVGREAFLTAARDEALMRELDVPGESFEGYLFPETYRIARGTPARDVVRRMHGEWARRWEQALERAGGQAALDALREGYGFDEHDVVILASLIERETNHDPERDVIARVFLNRLDKSMKLQTDPTCVYGEETYLEVPSPRTCKDRLNRYSTYVTAGLPPGPIANPGEESLVAALAPSTSKAARKYLFFVARRDGTGSHRFSETFAEHKRAIRKHLK
jgi:UPF0755 protein